MPQPLHPIESLIQGDTTRAPTTDAPSGVDHSNPPRGVTQVRDADGNLTPVEAQRQDTVSVLRPVHPRPLRRANAGFFDRNPNGTFTRRGTEEPLAATAVFLARLISQGMSAGYYGSGRLGIDRSTRSTHSPASNPDGTPRRRRRGSPE